MPLHSVQFNTIIIMLIKAQAIESIGFIIKNYIYLISDFYNFIVSIFSLTITIRCYDL